MTEFNPDAYLAEPVKKTDSFDPDAYLKEMPKEEPGVIQQTWNKVKAIPGGLVEVGKEAVGFGKRIVTGDVSPEEGLERLGTAARGAADVALAPGFAAGQYLSGQNINSKKPTQQIMEAISPETAQQAERQDVDYPGARAAGQIATVAALPGSSAIGSLASGIGGSAALQAANQGNVDTKETVSDVLSGIAPFAAAKGVTKLAGSAVGKLGGGKAAQFVENPANIKRVEHAQAELMDLKTKLKSGSVEAKRQIVQDLDAAHQKATGHFDTLKGKLAEYDAPISESADHTGMARAIMSDLQKNPFIDDESIKLINKIQDGAKTSTGKAMLNDVVDANGKHLGKQVNPALTEGESLELVTDLKQRLGETIEWGPTIGMSKTERLANKQLKDGYFKLDNYTKQVGDTLDPELGAVYKQANDSYSNYINSKKDIESIIGSKRVPSQKGRSLSENRLATTMQNAPEDVRGALNESVSAVSPSGAEQLQGLSKNAQIQRDLRQMIVDKKDLGKGGLSVDLPKIGTVGITPNAILSTYDKVRKTFNSPALTAAVRTLTLGGRTLSNQTIQDLATQHNVDPMQLEQTIREGGN